MRHAESVTFGGSGFDRAAWLRPKPDELRALLGTDEARILPVWRGKPLIAGSAAGWLAVGHPVFAAAGEAQVFLGLDNGAARFAADISGWEPEAGEMPVDSVFFDPTEQHHPKLPEDHRFAELRNVMATLRPRDAELVATAKALIGWHQNHLFCSCCGSPSEVADGGWLRRCPACGAPHFPRTDPVVIMLITRGNHTLLGRSPGWPEGIFSCLAGFMEPGETLEAAVRREVAEETGILVGAVRYLASQPWPYPSSLMIGCEGIATSHEITLDPVELEHALWLTREEVAQVLAGDHPTLRPPRAGAIAGFLLSNWVADRLD
ncbi:NADH pyrophosphatase [Defluviimonas aquaemixtae]|uniref:NAD(+) diphosphatase n=1 Tax=Albidovulum aquaemixtae TaxID=1542388 RepID=A0A2R8BNX4_9RHOB|nr:NAD(+) diphosphatase [Defluviimonas aquaemixtae]SPH25074.1 NADH pyrophosphatase [Defluviimonas aquaemixtae]